ncbi:MAG TPA: hypothetical protein VGE97_05490, partial [Nitrososphaera sp.]
TKQNASCDTVGAASPVSGSCDQRAVNNVNNGIPRTGGAAVPTTGTLLVNVVCFGAACLSNIFTVMISPVSNPQPPAFQGRGSGSQTFTLAPGDFRVDFESAFAPFAIFSGDCIQRGNSGSGMISPGQHLTCTITVARP